MKCRRWVRLYGAAGRGGKSCHSSYPSRQQSDCDQVVFYASNLQSLMACVLSKYFYGEWDMCMKIAIVSNGFWNIGMAGGKSLVLFSCTNLGIYLSLIVV